MTKSSRKVVKQRRRKLNIKKTMIFFLFLFLIINSIIYILKLPIKNIYIYNNNILSDQEIITIAKIENYPSTLQNISPLIEARLKKNQYLKKVKVKKKKLTEVHIEVEENYPLFINRTTNKTILLDGIEIDTLLPAPTLLNIVPDTKYKKFKEQMTLVDIDILMRISEIEYSPDDVENERFLFYMNDDNYVYITLDKISSINSYLDIIKNFNNKKGILYLDYGNHFKILE